MRKKILLGSAFVATMLLMGTQVLGVSTVQAASSCQYSSTQARIKRIGLQPWVQNLSLNCGEQFEVGGFHDQTGTYANDVMISVKVPNFPWDSHYTNGERVTAHAAGTYQVVVTTLGQTGAACQDTATVQVTCQPQAMCPYQSTQARVKKAGIQNPWQQDLQIKSCVPQKIEVGSFHNNTGVYATDTFLKMWMNNLTDLKTEMGNGEVFYAVPGITYHVKAKTRINGVTALGENCKDETTVQVICDRIWPTK